MKAFAAGDMKTVRTEPLRSVEVIKLLASYGYMGAVKATLKILGVDVNPAHLPNGALLVEQAGKLQRELEALGFFDWVK